MINGLIGLYNVRPLLVTHFKLMATNYISPSRGIRQGDPLSQYLFILVAEGLSHAIKSCSLQGLFVSRQGPSISHLLFANDSILFSQASIAQAEIIKAILHEYSAASGQSINLSKSAICFKPNTPIDIKR